MKTFSWRGCFIALAVTVGFTTVTFADHSWGGYHWAREANPFTLKVGDNVSSAWDAYLDEAISDWNASEVLELSKVVGTTRPRQCRATAGRIEVCNERYGNTGWLGIAQIWLDGLHITQATTKLNDTYFTTSTYNKPAWRRLVTCQEIAHDFGLDHQDEVFDNPNLGSCMDYTNNPLGPPSNEHPNSHDFAELIDIYSHFDSTTTAGASLPKAMPPAMGHIDFDTPAQWGQLVRSSRDGRVQLFELDFGRGHRVVTHVFWADPERDRH
ncbi:MAG TPA: hypothetical protein VFB92_06310 [Vicinamibacterales bacterium]|nr:hypothetical protein [Vicinamibacterales bacterium]